MHRRTWCATFSEGRRVAACLALVFAAVLVLARVSPAQAESDPAKSDGVVTVASPFGAEETLARVEGAIRDLGLKVFPRLDHAAAARDYGLEMPPSWVVIFGNPKRGTPNFIKNPTRAIDFPLKMLVYQDRDGQVRVAYNSQAYMQGIFERHNAPNPGTNYIMAVTKILDRALKQ